MVILKYEIPNKSDGKIILYDYETPSCYLLFECLLDASKYLHRPENTLKDYINKQTHFALIPDTHIVFSKLINGQITSISKKRKNTNRKKR